MWRPQATGVLRGVDRTNDKLRAPYSSTRRKSYPIKRPNVSSSTVHISSRSQTDAYADAKRSSSSGMNIWVPSNKISGCFETTTHFNIGIGNPSNIVKYISPCWANAILSQERGNVTYCRAQKQCHLFRVSIAFPNRLKTSSNDASTMPKPLVQRQEKQINDAERQQRQNEEKENLEKKRAQSREFFHKEKKNEAVEEKKKRDAEMKALREELDDLRKKVSVLDSNQRDMNELRERVYHLKKSVKILRNNQTGIMNNINTMTYIISGLTNNLNDITIRQSTDVSGNVGQESARTQAAQGSKHVESY